MLQNYRLANALRTADPNHSCGGEVKANTMNQPFKKVLSVIAISNCRFLSEFLVRVSLGQMCCYLQNKNLHSMIAPTLKDTYSLEKKGLNAILAELLLLICVSQNLLKRGGDQERQRVVNKGKRQFKRKSQTREKSQTRDLFWLW